MKRLPGTLALLLILAPAPAMADSALPPDPLSYTQLPDRQQEARAAALMYQIRCLVCQGQSIADSDAEMAVRTLHGGGAPADAPEGTGHSDRCHCDP